MLGTWEAQARHFRLEFQGWSSWCRANPAERSAEAPASTDAANPKLQGQSLALTPVASSGWFGDVFISSKSSGRSEETRLNSSHLVISYAVFCLKKKNKSTSSHTITTAKRDTDSQRS